MPLYNPADTSSAQPADSDLTAIAALTTTAFGRGLLDDATAAAVLTSLGVTAFAQTLLDDADAAAFRTTLGIAFSGALVTKAADETGANYSTGVMVPWTSETGGYDTDAYHDDSSNNTRLTIPANGKYRVSFGIQAEVLAASDYIRAAVFKNGSVDWVGSPKVITEISASPSIYLTATSAIVDCVATDYFEVWLDTESDTSINIIDVISWFAVQRVHA